MRLIPANPKNLLPWEHEDIRSASILERAVEALGQPIDEMMRDAQEYLSVSDAERMRRRHDRELRGWKYVAPVPVFEAPEDLLPLGGYVIFNGHNRVAAAKKAGLALIPCLLLEGEADFGYIKYNNEENDRGSREIGIGGDISFEELRRGVWNCARFYHSSRLASILKFSQ